MDAVVRYRQNAGWERKTQFRRDFSAPLVSTFFVSTWTAIPWEAGALSPQPLVNIDVSIKRAKLQAIDFTAVSGSAKRKRPGLPGNGDQSPTKKSPSRPAIPAVAAAEQELGAGFMAQARKRAACG